MTNRIRITLAVLMTVASLSLFSAPTHAAAKDQCAKDPAGLSCLQQQADEECAAHGPNSVECLSARNDYLEEYAANRDNWIATIVATLSKVSNEANLAKAEAAQLEKRVARQALTIKRLRDRLHAS